MWLDADSLSGPAQLKCQQGLIWREKWTESLFCLANSNPESAKLLAVQLDDELLVDRKLQVLAFRQGQNPAFVVVTVDF
jgi:hypothetical protein